MQKDFFQKLEDVFNKKSEEYGDTDLKVGKMMDILYPEGITLEQYGDFLFSLKILEKISRLSSKNISEEAKTDLMQDLAGYGILGTYNKRVANASKESNNG